MTYVYILIAANIVILALLILRGKSYEEEVKQIEEDYQELLKAGNDYPASMRKGK
jgi:hypothetical protein